MACIDPCLWDNGTAAYVSPNSNAAWDTWNTISSCLLSACAMNATKLPAPHGQLSRTWTTVSVNSSASHSCQYALDLRLPQPMNGSWAAIVSWSLAPMTAATVTAQASLHALVDTTAIFHGASFAGAEGSIMPLAITIGWSSSVAGCPAVQRALVYPRLSVFNVTTTVEVSGAASEPAHCVYSTQLSAPTHLNAGWRAAFVFAAVQATLGQSLAAAAESTAEVLGSTVSVITLQNTSEVVAAEAILSRQIVLRAAVEVNASKVHCPPLIYAVLTSIPTTTSTTTTAAATTAPASWCPQELDSETGILWPATAPGVKAQMAACPAGASGQWSRVCCGLAQLGAVDSAGNVCLLWNSGRWMSALDRCDGSRLLLPAVLAPISETALTALTAPNAANDLLQAATNLAGVVTSGDVAETLRASAVVVNALDLTSAANTTVTSLSTILQTLSTVLDAAPAAVTQGVSQLLRPFADLVPLTGPDLLLDFVAHVADALRQVARLAVALVEEVVIHFLGNLILSLLRGVFGIFRWLGRGVGIYLPAEVRLFSECAVCP